MSDSQHGHAATPVSDASLQAGHEVADADAGSLAQAGIAMAILIIVAFIGMIVMFRTLAYVQPLYDGEESLHPLNETRAVYEGPKLQPDPPRQKVAQHDEDRRILASYEWLDQETGIARIPVARAIDILAERGLPATPAPVAQ